MLIQINQNTCINTDDMKSVTRCGNYTDIITKDGRVMQIWDEKEELWFRITNAIKIKTGE